jgi:hypothetical protein
VVSDPRVAQLGPGSILSLPVPARRGERLVLAFFAYAEEEQGGAKVVLPPTTLLAADPTEPDGRNLQLSAARPSDFGYEVPTGHPLGTYIPALSDADQKRALESYHAKVDVALGCYKKPPSFLQRGEKLELDELQALFHRLAPVPLLPAYYSLSPELFRWIEQVNPPAAFKAWWLPSPLLAGAAAGRPSAAGGRSNGASKSNGKSRFKRTPYQMNEAEFEAAAGWRDQTVNILQPKDAKKDRYSIVVTRDELGFDETLERFTARQLEQLAENFSAFKLLGVEPASYDEVPARVAEYTWKGDQGTMYQRQAYFALERRALIFTISAMSGESKACGEKLAELLGTIKFRKEGGG